MRRLLFLFLCFSATQTFSQAHYNYSLQLVPEEGILQGRLELVFTNTSGKPLNKVVLHYPPRALEWKRSFLSRQFAEFQNVDLHYASREETGFLNINELKVKGISLPPCKECEFQSIPLPRELAPGDSVNIFLDFDIGIGSSEFNGVGFDGTLYRFPDWLPCVAPSDSQGFHEYPVTFQRDFYPGSHIYTGSFRLPKGWELVSNTDLKVDSAGFEDLYRFNHSGSNLQFFISQKFYKTRLPGNRTLYTLDPESFSVVLMETVLQQVDDFFEAQLGEGLPEDYNLIAFPNKGSEYQSDALLSIQPPRDLFRLASDVSLAYAEMLFRYRARPDGIKDVWLARGFPYYYKYAFIRQVYPDKKWLPLSNSFLGRFFSLDDFDYNYQNQFLYLYLARQGLDQKMNTPADSLTRLNYEAIAQSKSCLAINHLKEYIGGYNFSRGIRRFLLSHDSVPANPRLLEKSLQFYSNRNLKWFFENWLSSNGNYNYRLKKVDYCPTISTVTVVNKGELSFPYSITGYKDGKEVLTEWLDGHEGKKSSLIYHSEYDKVILNKHRNVPEFNQRDNTFYPRPLFKHTEPLSLQFYQTFENPEKSQIFWMPTANYNAYDKLLLGISFYNNTFIQKKFEYVIGPEFSFGQKQLTGYGSLLYNYIPESGSIFHQVSAGLYGRYYHYDEDLAYFRLSPGINFYFKKPYPKSSIIHRLRLRTVHVERELPASFEGVANDISNSSYSIFNANYRFEETHIFRPYTFKADLLWGNQFSRISVEGDLRWMLPNKKWLIWRNYAGYFFSNEFSKKGVNGNYYSLGLSGTQDFLFDYSFIGRSDSSGIWSQQFFITDGGFKSQTGVLADNFLLTTSLSVPIWKFFGVFGDAGFADDFSTLYYDYGFRLSLVTDFLEFYFPVANQNTHFLLQPNYLSNVRFVLDIDISHIINRLRRGYY